MLSEFNLLSILIFLGVLIVSISIHEMMHAYTGLKLGDDTAAEEGRISLNPLRHIDPFLTILLPGVLLLLGLPPVLAAKPVPFNPARVKWDEFGAALIAFAGPASNFVIAIIASLALQFADLSGVVRDIVTMFMYLNVGLFVFNLIPIPPLDGSRVLYAFAPDPVRRLFEAMEPYGLFIVLGLVALGGFGGLITSLNNMVINFIN